MGHGLIELETTQLFKRYIDIRNYYNEISVLHIKSIKRIKRTPYILFGGNDCRKRPITSKTKRQKEKPDIIIKTRGGFRSLETVPGQLMLVSELRRGP